MRSKLVLNTILAVIAGEVALAVLTTIAQEVLVDGVHWGISSTFDLLLGGIATLIAGVASGVLAVIIGGRGNSWPHIFLSLLIATETSYLIVSEKIGNPLWFAILSAAGLIAAVWLGFYFFKKNNRS
jgi:hypothetical protein